MIAEHKPFDGAASLDDDTDVSDRIGRLAIEEHELFGRADLSHEDAGRLARLQVELDRCWDLLRQRRALREYGFDPSEAHVRSAEVVKKYVG